MRRIPMAFLAAVAVSCGAAGAAVAASPTITLQAPSGVTTSEATVHATISPGGATTYYRVLWGLTSAYSNATNYRKLSSATSPRAISQTLAGLQPGTVYHYRIEALSKLGGAQTTDHTIQTHGNPPPDVVTGGAQVTSASSANVTGIVNPHGQATRYEFQYGQAGTLPGLFTVQQTLQPSATPQTVSFPITGLTPGTFFAYRVVAIHSGPGGSATTYGTFQQFLTYPAVRQAPGVRGSTVPHRILQRPFVLFTTGHLRAPSGIPGFLGCPQNGRLTIVYGRHRITDELVEVGADCRFNTQTTIGRLPRQRGRRHPVIVRVYIHFPGNGYVASTSARMVSVRLGS